MSKSRTLLARRIVASVAASALIFVTAACSDSNNDPNKPATDTTGESAPDGEGETSTGVETTCGEWAEMEEGPQADAMTALAKAKGNNAPSQDDILLGRIAMTVYCNTMQDPEIKLDTIYEWAEKALAGPPLIDPFEPGPLQPMPEELDTKPLGATPEGGIMLGQNLAPGGPVPEDTIRVDLIFDYICPYCGALAEQATDSFLAAAQAGEISLVMHPLGLLDQYSSTQYSSRAANAALTVASLAPEQFTDFDVKLWVNQPEEGGDGLSDEKIAELAKDAGVSDSVIAQFKDNIYADYVTANTTTIASMDGFRGTPMVLMTYNDQAYIYDWSQNKLGEAIDTIFDGG